MTWHERDRIGPMVMATLLLLSAGGSCGMQVARRAAIGAGLAAAVSVPPAFASTAGALKVASGYVELPKPAVTIAKLKAELYAPYADALTRGDWAAVGKCYLPTATLVQGGAPGTSPKFVEGSNVGSHFAGRGLTKPSLVVGTVVLEGEDQTVAHVTYNFKPTAGAKPYQGLQRVVRGKDGSWKIDEDVFPLENGKIYGMIKPQRDLLSGKVFMQLDPALRL